MNQVMHEIPRKSASEIRYFGFNSRELSQDLRTQLNSISGFAELLLLTEQGLSPIATEYVHAILSESRALTGALAPLLDRASERGARSFPIALAA